MKTTRLLTILAGMQVMLGGAAHAVLIDPGTLNTNNLVDLTSPSGGTITGSAAFGAYTPAKAFDNQPATVETSRFLSTVTSGAWIRYTFSAPVVVNTFRLWAFASTSAMATRLPKDFKFESSNDGGTTWTLLDTESGQTNWSYGEPRIFGFVNETAYAAYRLTVSANNGAINYTDIEELEFFCIATGDTAALVVSGSPGNWGVPTPGYGITNSTPGDSFSCSCPAWAKVSADIEANCNGYTVATNTPGATAYAGNTNVFTYTAETPNGYLTWLFGDARRYLVSADAGSAGIISSDAGEPDGEGRWWVPSGGNATLTVTASPGWTWSQWLAGELPEAARTQNPLVLGSITNPVSVIPAFIFGTDFHADADNGGDVKNGLSHIDAFQTFGKTYETAVATNAVAAFGSSTIRLWPASTDYFTSSATAYQNGGLTIIGEGSTPVPLQESRCNVIGAAGFGELNLSNIAFRSGSSSSYKGIRVGSGETTGGTVVSDNSSGHFVVTGGSVELWQDIDLCVGTSLFSGTNTPHVVGLLDLSKVSGPTSITLADGRIMYVGQTGDNAGTAYGILDLTSDFGGSLTCSGIVDIGVCGGRAEGRVMIGDNWNVKLGPSTGAAPNINIGLATWNRNSLSATGILHQAGGIFEANATDIRLGIDRISGKQSLYGELTLGSNVTSTQIRTTANFILGSEANGGTAKGIFDASFADGGSIVCTGTGFGLGYDSSRSGSLCEGYLGLGQNWTFQLGSSDAPLQNIWIAEGATFSTGVVSMAAGGTFEAFAKYVLVGRGASAGGSKNACGLIDLSAVTGRVTLVSTANMSVGCNAASAYGVIDARGSTNATLGAAAMYVGVNTVASSSYRCYGRISVGRGSGSASTLNIGQRYGTPGADNQGVLELLGQELEVSGTLTLYKTGLVRSVVADGKSAGLNLATAAASAIAWDGTYKPSVADGCGIRIEFASCCLSPKTKPANAATADGMLWGFRWKGNHVTEVNALIADGRMVIDTSALDETTAAATGVFYDTATDATHIGLYTRVARDGTLIRLY